MRYMLLLSFLFSLGCREKVEGDKSGVTEQVPKLGGLEALNSDADIGKVFALDKLYQEKKYSQVRSEALKYTQKYPYEGKGWQVLGNAQLALKQHEEAKKSFTKAVGYYEHRGYYGLGLIAYQAGNNALANELFQQLKLTDPYGGALALTRLSILEKKYPQALEIAKQIAAQPAARNDPGFSANLALAYHFNKDTANRDKELTLAKEQHLRDEIVAELTSIFAGQTKLRLDSPAFPNPLELQ